MNDIILHTCCAPCGSASIERLINEKYQVSLFFSNSNIYPLEEYEKRRYHVFRLAKKYGIPVMEDDYDHDKWLSEVSGLEEQPEQGKRCAVCFRYSMQRTANLAKKAGASFTTSLTISPHKSSKLIFAIGENFKNYEPFNFKKQDGFKRSIQLSTDWKIYRQNYCGCEFSMRKNT